MARWDRTSGPDLVDQNMQTPASRVPSSMILKYLRQLFFPDHFHQKQGTYSALGYMNSRVYGCSVHTRFRHTSFCGQPHLWFGLRHEHSSTPFSYRLKSTRLAQRKRSNIPKQKYVQKRYKIRTERAGKGTADTRWVRCMIRKIHAGNAESAEADWHEARLGGRDLQDLRRASKELMVAFNKYGRWFDTVRFFKWNEDATKLDARGIRRMEDVIRREDVCRYLAELDLRRKFQEDRFLRRQKHGLRLTDMLDVALDTLNKETPDPDFPIYFQDLRDTLLRLGRLPQKYLGDPVSPQDAKAFIDEFSLGMPPTSVQSGIDGELLDLMFGALLQRLDSERTITLFYQYQSSVKLTVFSWEHVITAYVNLGNLKKAQALIRFAVYRRKPLSHDCYGIMLYSIKAQGGSWEKMVRYFKWLEKVSGSTVATIYHVMIQTALERSMKDEADSYMKRMVDHGLPLNAKTCGDILSAQAKVKDWEALQKTLRVIDSQGFHIPLGSFNAVLNMYAEAKVYADTEVFFNYGLERGIVPDFKTYNIMIKAAVYAGAIRSQTLVPCWLHRMIADGIRPNEYTFNSLFQDLRQNYAASAALLRRVYQKILRMETSVKVLDECSKGMLLKTMYNENKPQKTRHLPVIAVNVDKDSFGNKEIVALQMASAIEVNEPAIALEIWKSFIDERIRPSFQMIILALRACMMTEKQGHLIPAILKIAKLYGIIFQPATISVIRATARKHDKHSINNENMDETFISSDGETTLRLDRVYARVEEVYQFLERHGFPISHHVAVDSANRLTTAGHPHAAIQLMHQVAKTKWGQQVAFDIVCLGVMMKAYYRAQDLNGIKWTVERIIVQNLQPSSSILKYLNAVKEQYKLVKDIEQERIVILLISQLGMHRAKLETESKKQAEFLVDFIKGTVGIRRKRRFSTNWPFLMKKGRRSTVVDTEMSRTISAGATEAG